MMLSPVFASACWLGLSLAASIAAGLTGVRPDVIAAAFVFSGIPAVLHLATGSRHAREASEIWVVFAWIALGIVAVLVSGDAVSPLAIMLVLGPLYALSIGRYRLGTEASVFSAAGYLAIAGIDASGIPLPGKNFLGSLTGLGVLISVLQVGIFIAVTRSMLAERRGLNRQLDRWMATLSDTPVLVLNVDRRRRIRSWVGDISLLDDVKAKTLSNGWLEDVFTNTDAFLKRGDTSAQPELKGKADKRCETNFLRVRDGYRFVITPRKVGLVSEAVVPAPVMTPPQADVTPEAGLQDNQSVWIASLGHELRNMLNPVGGYSDLILAERAGPVDEVYKGFARSIKQGAEHLGLLVDDLMTASKSRSGHLIIEPETLDLMLEAEDAANLLRWQSDASSVGIRVEDRPGDTLVHADRKALRQILVNLLSNAIKYSTAESEVTVRLERHISEAELVVSDTGEGMPAAELKRLGEPFFQGENARGRAGTGLGLSIVMMLAKAMNGRVEFESKLGEGTIVRVFLPKVQAEETTTDTQVVAEGGAEAVVSEPVEETASDQVNDIAETSESQPWFAPGDVWLPDPVSENMPEAAESVADDVISEAPPADEPEAAENLVVAEVSEAERVLEGVRQRLTKPRMIPAKDRLARSGKTAKPSRRPLRGK